MLQNQHKLQCQVWLIWSGIICMMHQMMTSNDDTSRTAVSIAAGALPGSAVTTDASAAEYAAT